ncbi:unnamed protein product [Dicrocoelium dendriticum]|nr:unnamed protein product [Dicrocoelium dendriticum]
MSTTTLRRDLNPISASVLSVVSWFCATSVDLSSAQLYSTRSSVDPLLGAKLPTDEESMFRLPNQSSLCERFINTYHLQSPSTNADYLKLPFLEIHPFSAWNDAHQTKSPRPLPGDPTSSIKSASTDRLHGTLGFGNYFESPSKDRGTRFYTFTSPAYPHNYPPDIDCIKIIRDAEGIRSQTSTSTRSPVYVFDFGSFGL